MDRGDLCGRRAAELRAPGLNEQYTFHRMALFPESQTWTAAMLRLVYTLMCGWIGLVHDLDAPVPGHSAAAGHVLPLAAGAAAARAQLARSRRLARRGRLTLTGTPPQ